MKKWNHCASFYRKWSKLLMIMKLTTFLLLVMVVCASAESSAQTRMSVKMEKATIKSVLEHIENSSEFRFFYESRELDLDKTIEVNFQNETINNILDDILTKNGFGYKFSDNYIAIVKTDGLAAVNGIAVQKTITGMVLDSDGQPLPGVTVLVKGTNNGTITDVDGNYSLSGVKSESILVFSFVGMVSQEINVGTQNTVNVTLREDSIGIDEVVAIGYGTKKKSELASAIVQMDGDVAVKAPTVNMTNALQGQLAGLNIRQIAGSPGTTNPVINIRGANTFRNNAALIVIDGVASADPDGLNRLNPNEIASVSVLKDASAAIYGIQASGGVIVVTTKRGKIGATKVNVKTSSAFQSPTRYAEMADAPSLMRAINARNELEGTSIVYSDDDIVEFTSGRKKVPIGKEPYMTHLFIRDSMILQFQEELKKLNILLVGIWQPRDLL